MTLYEQNRLISSRADLAAFVKALRKDFRENRHDWENNTLEAFLEALAAYIEDLEGYHLNHGKAMPDHPNWQTFGDLLMGARIYE